jgi:hypothetical protein
MPGITCGIGCAAVEPLSRAALNGLGAERSPRLGEPRNTLLTTADAIAEPRGSPLPGDSKSCRGAMGRAPSTFGKRNERSWIMSSRRLPPGPAVSL